jgi:hypothetical protein
MKNEIGQPSIPIQGQPTAKEVFNQAIKNPSSHGPMNNPFTPVDQLVSKKKGVPEAPNKVNSGSNKNAPSSSKVNSSSNKNKNENKD